MAVTADNPFAKFVQPDAAPDDAPKPDNPFAKFAPKPANDAGPAPDDDSGEAEPKPPEVDQKIPTSTYEGDPSLSGRDLAQAGRGAVSGILGFPGDIESLGVAGLSKLGLAKKDEGTFFPTSKDVEDTLFGPAADERDTGYRSLGGLAGGAVTPGGILKAGKGVGAIKGGIDTFRGIPAKGALENLSKDVTGRVAGAEAAKSQEALQAERRAAELQAQRDKLQQTQPGVAQARAETREMEPKPGQPPVALERKDALTRLQGDVAGAEKDLGAAKEATGAAKEGVTEAESAVETTKSAADALDQELLQKPGMSKEDFGERLETAVRNTADKLKKARTKEADYAGTLDRAGDVATQGPQALRVKTDSIAERINTIIETSVRNPTTRRQLDALRKELSNEAGDSAVEAMTVRQADSLRKTIDDAIASKVYAGDAVSKEALAHLKEIRKALTKAATDAWPEYREALGKFSTASRPLEFIEKNPLLRKVVADNPDAAEAAVTRSQIVGKLLSQANTADRKALQRLLAESPELRDAARLHFTESLFGGPEGLRSLKSVKEMQTWLVKNKPALDQLGLTSEFKDIRTSRETAQGVIDKAAGVAKESKATLKAAEEREKAIQKQLAARGKLAGRALDERVKPAIEAREKANLAKRQDVAKGAEAGAKRLEERAGKAAKTAAEKKESAEAYRTVGLKLQSAKDATEITATAKSAFDRLLKDKQITEAEFVKLRNLVNEAQKKAKDTEAMRKRVRDITKAAILTYAGYETFRGVSAGLGW